MKTNRATRGAIFLSAVLLAGMTSAAAGQGGDDHGDTCETATLLASGVPVQGVMGDWPDEDWFAFDAVAGQLYVIELHRTFDTVPDPAGTINLPSCGERLQRFTCFGNLELPDAAFIAAQSGRYTVSLDWSELRPGGPYQLSVTDLGPRTDDHANEPENGTPIPADGADIRAHLEYDLDVDCFRVDLAGGMVYALELQSELDCDAGDFSPTLSVRAMRTGTYYRYAGTDNYPYCGDDEPLQFSSAPFAVPLERAGEAQLRVEVTFWTRIGMGAYTLRMRPLGAIPTDDHGDSCDAATAVTPAPHPAPVAGVCYTDLDPDWFAFDAVAGRAYEVRLGGGWSSSLTCEVFAPGCGELIGENDQLPSNVVTFMCAMSGRYSVRVSQQWESSWIGAYTLSVADLGEVNDDFGDDHATATPIAADGTWIVGRIDHSVDEDVFRAALDENTVYAMEIDSLTDCVGMVAVLEGDPSGGRAEALDRSSQPECEDGSDYSPIRWYFVGSGHAGDRFVRVRTFSWPPELTGDYRARIYPVWTPKGDQAGTCDRGEVIEVGGPGAIGLISSPSDVDCFRFEAHAGRVYRIVNDFAPGYLSPRVHLPSADGGPACDIWAHEYGWPVVYAHREGWYSIRIDQWPFGDGTSYWLQVIDAGPATDDHADTTVLGEWVPTDGTETLGIINYEDDIDAFRVRLVANNTYRLRLRSLEPCASVSARVGWVLADVWTGWSSPCEAAERTFYIGADDVGDIGLVVAGGGTAQAAYAVSIELLSCSADMNADGRLDSLDFFLFLNLLMSGSSAADINVDGSTNTQDLFDFLVLFFNGCPA